MPFACIVSYTVREDEDGVEGVGVSVGAGVGVRVAVGVVERLDDNEFLEREVESRRRA